MLNTNSSELVAVKEFMAIKNYGFAENAGLTAKRFKELVQALEPMGYELKVECYGQSKDYSDTLWLFPVSKRKKMVSVADAMRLADVVATCKPDEFITYKDGSIRIWWD